MSLPSTGQTGIVFVPVGTNGNGCALADVGYTQGHRDRCHDWEVYCFAAFGTGSHDSLTEKWEPKGSNTAGPMSVFQPGSRRHEAGILASWSPALE